MTRGPQAPAGLAFTCTQHGAIIQVLRDDLGITTSIRPGHTFPALVAPGSYQKAFSFLHDLYSNQATFNWVINIEIAGEITPLHFAGGYLGNDLLVVGARSRSAIARLYDELMKINNEQVNFLRQTLKEQMFQGRGPQPEREIELYDELSRLNNELATAQRELARKNAELSRLNDLKNQFLGMAAHDLRNPLSVILTYSEFILDDETLALKDERREFLEIIQSSSHFMLELVDDLLDISRIETGKLELDLWIADLPELVRQNVARNRVLAERKDIELVLQANEEIRQMMIDASKIEQVLNNLIGNAVKFSPAGSRVEISLQADDEHALVKVQDHGPGIPPEEIGKIFLPFTRASTRSTAGEKGAGLGLAIVKRIVEGHGGRIWVESTPGVGSTFQFTLPYDRAASGSGQTLVPAVTSPETPSEA